MSTKGDSEPTPSGPPPSGAAEEMTVPIGNSSTQPISTRAATGAVEKDPVAEKNPAGGTGDQESVGAVMPAAAGPATIPTPIINADGTPKVTPPESKVASPSPDRPDTGQLPRRSHPERTSQAVRTVRMGVTRIDPWSAMKMSFLLSFAAAIGLIAMTAVLYLVLSGMSVFSDLDALVQSLQSANTTEPFTIMDYVAFPRVMALATVVGVVNVFLLTALGTVAAYLYNISAALVGGVQVTLTED